MPGPTITAKFVADTTQLTSGVNSATSGVGSKVSDMAKGAAVAIGGAFAISAVTDFAKGAVDAASSVQESMSKIGVVFGEAGSGVIEWSKGSAEAMGLSQEAALAAVGTYGNLATSMGLPQEQAAGMSENLVTLASDLASFNNMPVDQALQALQSGLVGETEPLRKFGVNLNAAAVEAQAMAMGLSDGKAPLSDAAKMQATYALIMAKSTNAQGDFQRTSEGLANQNKINAAKFDDMQAKLGAVLLPVMTEVAGFLLNSLLPAFEAIGNWISDHQELMLALGIGLAAAGVAVMATLVPAFIAWAGAAWGAAAGTLAAIWPFLLIGAAVAAVAYLIISNWDTVKSVTLAVWDAIVGAVKFVWDWISENWPLILGIITGPIGIAVLLITRNWDTIKAGFGAAIDFIRNVAGTIFDIISTPFRLAWSFIGDIFERIKGAATSVKEFMQGVFNNLGDVLTAPIKMAWNGLASLWNGSVGNISISIPDWVPGVGGNSFDVPDLPRLARGGVLTKETLFIGGEAGTEIVAPEDMLRTIVAEESGAASYTLNMYPRIADEGDVAYAFQRLELMAGTS